MCIYTFFETTQTMGLSVIGGTGRQAHGAICTIIAYWMFAIPLAWYFGLYKEMGTKGLWIGPTAACVFLTITNNILIACINWPEIIKEVRERREN